MPFDSRPQRLYRRPVNGFDLQHRVGITHGNRANRDALVSDLQGIRIGCSRHIERERTGIEAGYSHIDGNDITAKDASVYQSRRTIHGDRTRRHASAPMEQGSDAARAVTALFDFDAVGVEYPVENSGLRPSGWLQNQRLVIPDTRMPVREPPELLTARHGLAGGRIEHDKVVTRSMHLREIDAHGYRITETLTVRSGLSTQSRAVTKQAAVHHGENTGITGTRRRRLIDHAILEPQRGQSQLDALVDNASHVFRPAEDIDNVHPLIGTQRFRQMLQVGHHRLTQNHLGVRRHWNDSITKALQSARHTVTGPSRVG
jgi:hypothetical protein